MIYLISFICLYILFYNIFSRILKNKNEKILLLLKEGLDKDEEIIQYSFFNDIDVALSFFLSLLLLAIFPIDFRYLGDIILSSSILILAGSAVHFSIKYRFSEILIITNKSVIHHTNCIKAKIYFNEINNVTLINYLVGKVILFRLQNNKKIYIWGFPDSKDIYKKINEILDKSH